MLQLLLHFCHHVYPPLPLPHMHVILCMSASWLINSCIVQLDFAIVVVSVIVLALDSLLPGMQWLKGLRVLRALKPLR